jgi:hypothetical protein
MPEGWVLSAASRFWTSPRAAALSREFPRDIARVAPRVCSLAVTPVDHLTVAHLQQRVAMLGLPPLVASAGRRLHGGLVASEGVGFIFVDAADSEDERRYTVAHELGHFISDYLEPRRHTLETHGPAALEILDGRRDATFSERVRALVAGDRLVAHVDLMGRDESAPDAESRADRLAMELLAPEEEAEIALASDPHADPAMVLRRAFGLPPAVALSYARWLRPPAPVIPGDWVLAHLERRLECRNGFPLAECRTFVQAPEESR